MCIQEQVHPRIRADGVDVGARAFALAQPVADAVLRPQVAVLQAAQRAADRRRVHAQRLFRSEPSLPGRIAREGQDVVFGADFGLGDLDQDARC
ncbi:hypothetical protein CDEF62S_04441 [Castellaniella defragrans]